MPFFPVVQIIFKWYAVGALVW